MPARPLVLIADDDPGVRNLARSYLNAAGYDVDLARDGEEVGIHLMLKRPDAIVLDINMPKLDGFAVLKRMRESGQIPGIPVLILTARHAAEDVRQALSLGAKDYLSKPFKHDQFLARVARLIGRKPISI